MLWIRSRSIRPGRPVLLGVVAAVVTLLGACGSSPGSSGSSGSNGAGGNSATVQLNPASGPESSSPTWSTTTACATGYQGSAIFRMVLPTGHLLSLSTATNIVNAPFKGTLLDPISTIQAFTNIPDGHTAELVVICFSGDSLTGKPDAEMHTFITFSADGKTYATSATAPAGFTPPSAAS